MKREDICDIKLHRYSTESEPVFGIGYIGGCLGRHHLEGAQQCS